MSTSLPSSLSSKTSGPVMVKTETAIALWVWGERRKVGRLGGGGGLSFTNELWALYTSCGNELVTTEDCLTAGGKLERETVTFSHHVHTVRLQ